MEKKKAQRSLIFVIDKQAQRNATLDSFIRYSTKKKSMAVAIYGRTRTIHDISLLSSVFDRKELTQPSKQRSTNLLYILN